MCRFSVILQPHLIHVQLVRLLSLHTLARSCRYAVEMLRNVSEGKM